MNWRRFFIYIPKRICKVISMNMNIFDNKSVGSNIAMLRMKHGMRQIDLARNIEISQTHMSNIENGNTGISLLTACKISSCLGCSIDDLVYGIKENKKTNSLKDIPITLTDVIKALELVACNKHKE